MREDNYGKNRIFPAIIKTKHVCYGLLENLYMLNYFLKLVSRN